MIKALFPLPQSLLVTCLFLALAACDNQKNKEKVSGPGGNSGSQGSSQGQNKPDFGVAPTFDTEQLKLEQQIQWLRTSNKGDKECVLWEITEFANEGIRLEGRQTLECFKYDSQRVRYIFFNPKSGKVMEDVITTAHSKESGGLKTIFDHLYGSKEKVEFKRGKIELGKKLFPAFQVKGKSTMFLDQLGHAFHGFAIKWSEVDSDGIKWNYELLSSDPQIDPLEDEKD